MVQDIIEVHIVWRMEVLVLVINVEQILIVPEEQALVQVVQQDIQTLVVEHHKVLVQ